MNKQNSLPEAFDKDMGDTLIVSRILAACLLAVVILLSAYAILYRLSARVFAVLYRPFVKLHQKVRAYEFRENAGIKNPH